VEKLGAEVIVKVTYRDYLQFPDDGRRDKLGQVWAE